MLLKLPIILSSNSFYFNQLFPTSIKHPTISLTTVKLQYILLLHEVQKRSVIRSISKGNFQGITLLWIQVILYYGFQFV